MSDEWTLQQKQDVLWVNTPFGWAEQWIERGGPMPSLDQMRWRHDDGHTQPARTDDDGRLLGPVTGDPQYEVVTLSGDGCTMPDLQETLDYCERVVFGSLGGHDMPDRPDPHIRAQLVDGCPGGWQRDEDDDRLWWMRICDDYRAGICHLAVPGVAVGFVECLSKDAKWRWMPGTQVRAHEDDHGEDYIMICAQHLSEKVDAVREFVARLRD